MKNSLPRTASALFLALCLAACSAGAAPATVVEVTRLAPQTVEVTRVALTTVVKTGIQKPTATPYFPDPAYYEGTVVITQYFTFLGHGFYEEAYKLLSPAAQPEFNREYGAKKGADQTTVELISILPWCVATPGEAGNCAASDPGKEKRFVVTLRAWGLGNMGNNAIVDGYVNTIDLRLVRQAGEWKINAYSLVSTVAYPSP